MFEASDGLRAALGQLTVKQQRAVWKIVEAEARGETLSGLLVGPGKVCARDTYYRKPGGWNQQERWQRALGLAREEWTAYQLEHCVEAAAETLRLAAPEAAVLLRRLVELGGKGLEAMERALVGEATDEELERLGVAARLVMRGHKAAVDVADRADVKTAIKQAESGGERWAALLAELRGMETAGEG